MINNFQPQIWLVIGSIENWITALSQPIPIWGLRESYYGQFNALAANDYCIFYVKSPVKGIVGIGLVKDKYIDRTNKIWKEELADNKVIWPLKFRLQVLSVLPFESWKSKSINELASVDISDLPLIWQIGFQQLNPEMGIKVFERIKKQWGIKDFVQGATILRMPISIKEEGVSEPQLLKHKELQKLLAEAGKMQHYYSETEYKLPIAKEDKRLDVIWKRELNGVPTYAFEVEISHGVEKAIARLKTAFSLWNTKPRLVVLKNDFEKVRFYLDREEHSLRQEFFFFDPQGVYEILSAKQKFKDIEAMYKIW